MNDSKCNFEVRCKVLARLKYRLIKNKRASQRAQFVRQIESLPCSANCRLVVSLSFWSARLKTNSICEDI